MAGFAYQIIVFVYYMPLLKKNQQIEFETLEDVNIKSFESIKIDDNSDSYKCIMGNIEGKLEGLSKEDINIDYDNDHISINVSREALKESGLSIEILQDKDYAERSFYVTRVERKRVQVVYNADVLRIYLKKLPEAEEGTTIIDVEDYTVESKDLIK